MFFLTNRYVLLLILHLVLAYGCLIPETPEHGSFSFLNNDTFSSGEVAPGGTTLSYKCHKQYALYPPNEGNPLTCIDGKWSSKIPKCLRTCPPRISEEVEMKCQLDGKPRNCSAAMLEGTVVDMRCKIGYELESSKTAAKRSVCKDGSWDYNIIKCIPECGKISTRTELIIGGSSAQHLAFPWHVVVYKKNVDQKISEQICSGTLISMNIVVSAALCFADQLGGGLYDISLYSIAAGKKYRSLSDSRDTSAQTEFIKQINISEHYAGLRNDHRNDVAVIVLQKPFTLSNSVKPACLDWTQHEENQVVQPGSTGELITWDHSNMDSKHVTVKLIGEEQCKEMAPKLMESHIIPEKFCAVHNNASVCMRDSGAGLVFLQNQTQRYYVRGVATGGPGDPKTHCSNTFTLYSRLGPYLKTIAQMKSENGLD